MADTRLQLLEDLQKTSKEYTAAEKKRLQNLASVLKGVLAGRTGGRGLQSLNTTIVASAAKKDLAEYLSSRAA